MVRARRERIRLEAAKVVNLDEAEYGNLTVVVASETADQDGRETKKLCMRTPLLDFKQPLAQRIYDVVVKAYPLQAKQIVYRMMEGTFENLQALAENPESQQAACKTIVAQLVVNDTEADEATLFRVSEAVRDVG